jgi:hypothetical protein
MVQEVDILFLSAAEGPVLTANQKKLVEMLEEIRSIREAQR